MNIEEEDRLWRRICPPRRPRVHAVSAPRLSHLGPLTSARTAPIALEAAMRRLSLSETSREQAGFIVAIVIRSRASCLSPRGSWLRAWRTTQVPAPLIDGHGFPRLSELLQYRLAYGL